MWEGGTYFNVDTQRGGDYKRAVLIRGNMALLGLAQLYFYCTFFDTTLLFIPYPAKICAFKRLEQKFAHSSSYIKSIGRYLV